MQVLLNLQSNALKFTEKGHVTISTSLECGEEATMLVIEVQDSGLGIKDEDHAKLFKLFGFLHDDK